ncbi:cell wall hydrolase [Corynebacterium diphtheriae]|uniref:cell wall hydrolase n=1 Tax=Corynebacterium diphtheriae TaxID=1717 RepID=UPI000D74F8F4|nr:cell wall hydrolase [Corynebacterium diphtheriae]AWR16175.1 cell wall hydrolase interfering with FtsZ ring assembly [Corynebacterium diphtheriae]CAB0653654.1 cell wall hydrolase [Corynebacterium diphtheriae]
MSISYVLPASKSHDGRRVEVGPASEIWDISAFTPTVSEQSVRTLSHAGPYGEGQESKPHLNEEVSQNFGHKVRNALIGALLGLIVATSFIAVDGMMHPEEMVSVGSDAVTK